MQSAVCAVYMLVSGLRIAPLRSSILSQLEHSRIVIICGCKQRELCKFGRCLLVRSIDSLSRMEMFVNRSKAPAVHRQTVWSDLSLAYLRRARSDVVFFSRWGPHSLTSFETHATIARHPSHTIGKEASIPP
ncbi:hypothetical protein F4677DRAFT_413885, partial [Hypoxylon crocopeplum]